MEQVQNNFFNILKEYFAKLDNSDILIGNKSEIEIPMNWFFTEKLDREIIKKTFINIFENKSPNYRNKATYLQLNPDDIESFVLQLDNNNNNNIQMLVTGQDRWSKCLITDSPNENNRLSPLTTEEFFKKILETIKVNDINNLVSTHDIDDDMKEALLSLFPLSSDTLAQDGIRLAMENAATNLTKYYDYLIKLRNDSKIIYGGIIAQRSDNVLQRNIANKPNSPRKSDIYPLPDRTKILDDLEPLHIIQTDQQLEDGTITKSAFVTYIYKNPRDKAGYLFVCEPLEGSHATRIIFFPQDKFEKYDSKSKFVDIITEYLEMSPREFKSKSHTRAISHTELDSFKCRIEHAISGKSSPTIEKHPGVYSHYDDILYNGEVPVSLTTLAKRAKLSDVPSHLLPDDKTNENKKGE